MNTSKADSRFRYAVYTFSTSLLLLFCACQGPVTIYYDIDENDIRDATSIVFNISASDLGPSPTRRTRNSIKSTEEKAIPNRKYLSQEYTLQPSNYEFDIFLLDADRCKTAAATAQLSVNPQEENTYSIKLDFNKFNTNSRPCEVRLEVSDIDEIRILPERPEGADGPEYPPQICEQGQPCIFYTDANTPVRLTQGAKAVFKQASWDQEPAIAGSDGYQYRIGSQTDGFPRTKRSIKVTASERPFLYSKTAGGFWTYTPIPSGISMNAVFGISQDAIWAVGDRGTILYWDGRGWMQERFTTTPSSNPKCPSWGAKGTLCNLYAVWGEKRGEDYDVWAVGENGLVLRRTLGIWHEIPGIQDVLNSRMSARMTPPNRPINLRGVWGFGNGEMVIVGGFGTILYVNSKGAWLKSTEAGAPKDLDGLFFTSAWGLDGTCFWVAGAQQTLLRWGCAGAQSWRVEDVPTPGSVLGSTSPEVSQIAAAPLWSLWGTQEPGGDAGLPLTKVWAVGGQGTILSYDGHRWQRTQASADRNGRPQFRSLWGRSSSDLWAVGNFGVVFHLRGQTWSGEALASGQQASDFAGHLSGVWAAPGGPIWVAGSQPALLRAFDSPEGGQRGSGANRPPAPPMSRLPQVQQILPE